MLTIAALIALSLIALGVSRMWRTVVFLPSLIGAIGLLQVRAQTCVALAARGLRNMDAGDEPITDAAELQAVRAQARQVYVLAAVLAFAGTAVVLILPAENP